MSLGVLTSPLSAINPKIWFADGVLHARTNLLLQILCLFFWKKRVEVDPATSTIRIYKRYLWILESTTEISFSEISHLEYRYGSLTTSWDLFGNSLDRVEAFTVDLALHDQSEVRLLSFRGDGAVRTGMIGVALGDSVIDAQGDQEQRSLAYIDFLQELTGKGLSKFSKPNRYRVR